MKGEKHCSVVLCAAAGDACLEDRFVCMPLRNTHLIPFNVSILSFYIRLLWAQQVQVSCFVRSCFVLFLFE